MSGWTPPKYGSPVWVDIASNDLARAQKFYSTVFNWSFKPTEAKDKDADGKPELAKFDFNPDVNLTGCVRRVPEETGNLVPGRGGICLYWLVEDLDKISEAIKGAGGKVLSDTVKEGQYGLYRFFEDTEGNMGAVYQLNM
ncbi:hypothetical protein B0T16DRAFT_460143 [Cercophora newfieldiana]|uniref:VOC domain-containing protein n=1 Tax=Cercophora newfieldiana TaxID=92897 RepID=A0AA40CMJ5_9PEZI|nr:hypothetical protein B0T16DRAFT_460143 [Cercophora newfieldiana]